MTRKVTVKGQALLRDPLLNKGTAFCEEEREKFQLQGLLPCNIESIVEQLHRCRDAYEAKDSPIEKHIYLRALQDRNEVLFYRFVLDNLLELLPIVYTPVVGEACQLFHRIYRQPRGLFLSYPERHNMAAVLGNIAKTRKISVIVVTDGERILGLGDQGAGGLGIPIGKLTLYTVCGGINPAETLPIVLDVGTNNQDKFNDPEYLGWRHPRINGADYDNFIDQFVQTVKKYFPNVLLQFEDFAQQHAYPILEKYRDQLCTFNDDIQGTAAVSVAAIIAAARASGVAFTEHRVAVFGAGSAGCGISEQLVRAMVNEGLAEDEARRQFFLVDRNGLLHDGLSELLPFQKGFVHPQSDLLNWKVSDKNNISLLDVMQNAKPTILLGVSGQPNQFSEEIIKTMAGFCQRPIVLPLSNPTSRAEAVPENILKWTNGRALVATGSPFPPVQYGAATIPISQCNNSYIFPGVGLGVVAGKAKRVTDTMMMAAALALSNLSPAMSTGEGCLLPEISLIRDVSRHIAKAVIIAGMQEGHVKKMSDSEIEIALKNTMWYPEYDIFVS